MTAFISIKSKAAHTKPTIGDKSRDLPIFVAWVQSTPLVPVRAPSWAAMNWLARPTPMIDPISVCELDAGRPKYHVPRFQMMAATSSANTMAKPALLPTCRMSSTGRSEMIPNATSPLEKRTPRKFQNPDHTTAICGSSEWV